jgi:cobalt/nickel transport system permease protein
LLYQKIAGPRPTGRSIVVGSLAAAIVGLQLGALGVVFETLCSGISDLPLGGFLLLMQPIHLAIGVIEGLVTAAVVTFVWKARPEIMDTAGGPQPARRPAIGKVVAGFLVISVLTAGVLSWFASTNPDGLEWSVLGVSGKEELEGPQKGLHALLAGLQEKIALFPDYDLRKPAADEVAKTGSDQTHGKAAEQESWPSVSTGTSVAGLVGGLMTLIIAGLIGIGLRKYQGMKR